MTENEAKSVLEAAQQHAKDVLVQQIANGKPDKGITKARHAAILAAVAVEMVESFGKPEDSAHNRAVLRAAYAGSLLNPSQFRQEMEKAGVLKKASALDTDYED
jgi:predicted house-cleaning NTP pyrophosphatase (Maf/HAM1 superfamily)